MRRAGSCGGRPPRNDGAAHERVNRGLRPRDCATTWVPANRADRASWTGVNSFSSAGAQTSRIRKPSALVSFGLPDPLSFRVREHAMVGAERGANLDRASVNVL